MNNLSPFKFGDLSTAGFTAHRGRLDFSAAVFNS